MKKRDCSIQHLFCSTRIMMKNVVVGIRLSQETMAALTATPTTLWWAAKFTLNPKVSTVVSRKDVDTSTQLGQQSQTCASASPTPLKRPSGTAPHQVLKKDGTTSVSPFTTRPWTRGRTKTGLKLALPNSSQRSQPSGKHCSTTRGSLLIRHSLH